MLLRKNRLRATLCTAYIARADLEHSAYQPVQIQREVAVDHLTLKETEAAQTLSKELAKMLKEQEEANRRLQDLVQDSGNQIMIEQLNARKEELDKQIVETKRQIDELKLRVMQRLARFGRAIFHVSHSSAISRSRPLTYCNVQATRRSRS